MLSLTGYEGLARLRARFEALPEAIDAELEGRIAAATEIVYRQAYENIGQMFRNPGKMQSALKMTVTRLAPGSVEGTVSIEGAGYAALERGSGPHWIFPVHARALAFESGGAAIPASRVLRERGGPVFAADVHHPGTRAYHFLRSAIADKHAEIRASFADLTSAAWNKT